MHTLHWQLKPNLIQFFSNDYGRNAVASYYYCMS